MVIDSGIQHYHAGARCGGCGQLWPCFVVMWWAARKAGRA